MPVPTAPTARSARSLGVRSSAGRSKATQPRVGRLSIADAARTIGVSPSALRLWERQGLVRPVRTPAGTRRYGPDDIARLRTIRRLRLVDGLNAAAIRRILAGDPGRSSVSEGLVPPLDPAASERIGPQLRSLRQAQGLTLRAAAEQSRLSTSFISALERGLTGAALSTLKRLVTVYGSTLGELLQDPSADHGRLVPAADRRVMDAGRGVRIEDLATAPAALESQLFVLAPGATSSGAYSHAGEEFMYVLDGSLGVWLADAEYYQLAAGDALTFPSSMAHRFQALGQAETRLIWVNTPPTF